MAEYRVKRSKSNESLPEIVELLADAVAAANLINRRRILASATPGQRLLCAYYFYRDDVTNGGHWQYFENYTGNLWQEALDATKVLRLREEKVLRDAVALFPNRRPAATQRERRQQLAKIKPASFEKLDDRFYALQTDDSKIRQYIRMHPGEFFLPRSSRSAAVRVSRRPRVR